MSNVAFHSPDHGPVRVDGTERAWAGALCMRLMEGVLSLDDKATHSRLLRMVHDGHYIRKLARDSNIEALTRSLRTAIRVDADFLTWNGHSVDPFTLALNTALVIGGDALRFSARMHGSCEIHGWIDGPNRAWLADIIEEGLASGVLRHANQNPYENWPGVLTMLRSASHTPVVMSYSVTGSFPNLHMVRPSKKSYNAMTDDEQDQRNTELQAWEALDASVQWEQALKALRALHGALEIRPDDWRSFRFTPRLSAFDLLARDWESRLNLAFPA